MAARHTKTSLSLPISLPNRRAFAEDPTSDDYFFPPLLITTSSGNFTNLALECQGSVEDLYRSRLPPI